jgi:adenosylcobinamide-GDP ribazoletransferase
VGGLRLALSWLTVLPVPGPATVDRRVATSAIRWAPAAGVLLGGSATALLYGLGWLGVPAVVAALLVLAALALATRGMHLDGLADTADGLGSRAPAERALAIMRQSDIGPFGVLAVVFAVGVDVSALATLPHGPWACCGALAVAAATGRLAAVHASCARPAHANGFGALVHDPVAGPVLVVETVAVLAVGAALALWCGADPWWWAGSQAVALAVAAGLRWHTSRRLGGTTGDVYGALIETATAVTLVGLALH